MYLFSGIRSQYPETCINPLFLQAQGLLKVPVFFFFLLFFFCCFFFLLFFFCLFVLFCFLFY